MAAIQGVRLPDDSIPSAIQAADFNYAWMTSAQTWNIFIASEGGIIEIIPSQHVATVEADGSLSLEKQIVTASWQGYCRSGLFTPASEFVG